MLSWKIPEIGNQFEALHALANLLVVVPENLNEACSSQLLVGLPKLWQYDEKCLLHHFLETLSFLYL